MDRVERNGPVGPRASDDTPYTTLVCGGVKDEGAHQPFILLAREGWEEVTERAAMALLESEIEKFIASKPAGVVEWRLRPGIEHFHNYDGSIAITARCRLAVVKEAAEAA